ncbi:2,4'-dihydroxyacetophenone dioxygenase family protein [Cupriavidus sp. USMAHM13]|uniref:2,4'-dihydroxyacetophenone dioxygenase family protein n=1 Tax=Cupriavidus sp. USMAHM13 TaxID=1389192 RepID=UPI0018D3FF5E|nr:2,4'-dihydroxyacetophenone dioxygenase family protein [Cupriavidus sp. USMAHM13]
MTLSTPVPEPASASSAKLTARLGRDFIDADAIPWTPWVMAGTYFKLLAVNELSGGFTMLLKVDAGTKAPVHAHLGSAEAFLLEGGFYYDADDPGQAGCYTYEAGGAVHEPVSPQGCIMFAVSHGPLGGCDAQGQVNAVVDCRTMLALAEANGTAGHVVRVTSAH